MRRICLLICLALMLAAPARASAETRTFTAMDTVMTVTAEDADSSLLEACEDEARRLEALMSVTDASSEIFALNHDGSAHLSAETREVLASALSLCRETDGALDVTIYPIVRAWGFTTGAYRVPDEGEISALLARTGWENVALDGDAAAVPEGYMIDLGAVAKGYCGDRIVARLKAGGADSAIISLGGNIACLGSKPDGSAWRVGIRDPKNPDGLMGVVSVRDACVITSGSYERRFTAEDGQVYGHIFDPKTGAPARSGLASVTVISNNGLYGDALSTALFVMGAEKAGVWLEAHPDVQALLVDERGEIWRTADLGEGFAPQGAYAFARVHIVDRGAEK